MKKVSSIIDIVKQLLKYSAYVIVAVDIINYALRKFEELQAKEDAKNSKKSDFNIQTAQPVEPVDTVTTETDDKE